MDVGYTRQKSNKRYIFLSFIHHRTHPQPAFVWLCLGFDSVLFLLALVGEMGSVTTGWMNRLRWPVLNVCSGIPFRYSVVSLSILSTGPSPMSADPDLFVPLPAGSFILQSIDCIASNDYTKKSRCCSHFLSVSARSGHLSVCRMPAAMNHESTTRCLDAGAASEAHRIQI